MCIRDSPNSRNLRNHRIVYSGIEDIKQDLKNHFRISLLKKDWTKNFKEFELINQKFIKVYDSLKKKFFMRKVLGNSYINLDENEISFFSNFFRENSFFSDKFLEPRPLLKAVSDDEGAVLLIDEIDKSDDEFEAFLLEILSDYQVSIPEIGTIEGKVKPIVFLTSNNTREIGDALKRRCLHLYIPFPDAKLEEQIIASRVPDIEKNLKRELVNFVQNLRDLDLKKLPSVAETIDWANH